MLMFEELALEPKERVEQLKNNLILDEEELEVFDLSVRRKTAQEIAFVIHKSPRSVFYIRSRIKTKIQNYYKYSKSIAR